MFVFTVVWQTQSQLGNSFLSERIIFHGSTKRWYLVIYWYVFGTFQRKLKTVHMIHLIGYYAYMPVTGKGRKGYKIVKRNL